VRHRVAHELLQVLAGRKLARLDPSRPRLGGKREALGLSAARTRVVEEHRSLGARRERKGNTHAKRAVRRGEREQQADGGEYRENVVTADQEAHGCARERHCHDESQNPDHPTMRKAEEHGELSHGHAAEDGQPSRELSQRRQHPERQDGGTQSKGRDRLHACGPSPLPGVSMARHDRRTKDRR
jgi:hypothetical protein